MYTQIKAIINNNLFFEFTFSSWLMGVMGESRIEFGDGSNLKRDKI